MLVGPAGAGKSTFAGRHFPRAAILASDAFREMVSGDAADQSVTEAAFRARHEVAGSRMARGLLTVVDATNLRFDARAPLLDLAWRFERPAVAICFALSLEQCLAWNGARPGRRVPAEAVRRQHRLLQRALPQLKRDGFDAVHILDGVEGVASAMVGMSG